MFLKVRSFKIILALLLLPWRLRCGGCPLIETNECTKALSTKMAQICKQSLKMFVGFAAGDFLR